MTEDRELWKGIAIGVVGTVIVGVLLILMGILAFEV
jgi:hypothetical protein